jgi:FKBP-type peptidyl-prolyl cis-trans isomerase
LRKFLAVLAALILIPALTACSPAAKTYCDPFVTGNALNNLKVTGSFGSKPTIDFPSALSSKKIETKVISEGSGPAIVGEQFVRFDYTVLNGTTKQVIGASKYDSTGGEAQFIKSGTSVDICHGLSGVKQGSRVAIVIPAGVATSTDTAQLKKTDSVLFVMDIQKVYLQTTSGAIHATDSGMPTVVFAPNGTPGVTIPKTAAPTSFKLNTLLDGAGETVALGDTVTLNYSGFLWETGDMFDSSWSNGKPVQFQITNGGLIPGFVKALVGAKLGSKVVAVLPPELGYGTQGNGTIPANATLVFVIEVLGIDKPAK